MGVCVWNIVISPILWNIKVKLHNTAGTEKGNERPGFRSFATPTSYLKRCLVSKIGNVLEFVVERPGRLVRDSYPGQSYVCQVDNHISL